MIYKGNYNLRGDQMPSFVIAQKQEMIDTFYSNTNKPVQLKKYDFEKEVLLKLNAKSQKEANAILESLESITFGN